MTEICVDASFALKLVLPEAGQESVRERFVSWARGGAAVVAPWLFVFETHSALHARASHGEIPEAEAAHAWRLLRRQGIRTMHPRGLFDRAWTIASELRRVTTYDSVYLALADLRDCELWTADERFASAARDRYPRVRSLE